MSRASSILVLTVARSGFGIESWANGKAPGGVDVQEFSFHVGEYGGSLVVHQRQVFQHSFLRFLGA